MIVEDVIGSGRTLHHVVKELQAVKPKTVKIATLLEKQTSVIKADFAGFSIPDVFVVGYSIDYNEMYRGLNHLSILNAEGIAKYRIPEVEPNFC